MEILINVLEIIFITVGFPLLVYFVWLLIKEGHSLKFIDRNLIALEKRREVEEILDEYERRLDKKIDEKLYAQNVILTDAIINAITKRIKKNNDEKSTP